MKEVRVTTIFRADDLVNQKFAFFSYLNAYRVYAAMRKESKIKETNREKRTRESRIRLMRHDRTIRRGFGRIKSTRTVFQQVVSDTRREACETRAI